MYCCSDTDTQYFYIECNIKGTSGENLEVVTISYLSSSQLQVCDKYKVFELEFKLSSMLFYS